LISIGITVDYIRAWHLAETETRAAK
jgi:hypothetical protein